MTERIPISAALKTYDFNKEERKKLKIIPEIKTFARDRLQMSIDEGIYTNYIQLDRPYVTYLLTVSEKFRLKAYTWYFPVTGTVPYKGFFKKGLALREAKTFPREKYDTYVRGVSAYSTLGWFEDAILSSMLSYSEHGFAVMIFHELAHTVLFFKGHVNFNERFAEFIGRKAGELFFLAKDGEDSEIVRTMRHQWVDELLFSSFMEQEYRQLDEWYKANKGHITNQMKTQRLKAIQVRFAEQMQPQMKTSRYDYFPKIRLNNAILLSYRAYNYKMDEFEKLFTIAGKSIKRFIDICFQFKEAADPEVALSRFIKQSSLPSETKR